MRVSGIDSPLRCFVSASSLPRAHLKSRKLKFIECYAPGFGPWAERLHDERYGWNDASAER